MASVLEGEETDRYENVEAFSEKVRGFRGRAPILPVELTHGDSNGELGLPGSYTEAVDGFIRSIT